MAHDGQEFGLGAAGGDGFGLGYGQVPGQGPHFLGALAVQGGAGLDDLKSRADADITSRSATTMKPLSRAPSSAAP